MPTEAELEAVQTALDSDAQTIITAGTQLGKEAAQLVMATATPIKKLQDRLIRDARKQVVALDNQVDLIQTRLLTSVNTWIQEAEFLLQNLAVKGGMIRPGDPLIAALANTVAQEPGLELGATMVLEVSRLGPYFKDLIEVLREIRDRMPGTPVRYKGEAKAADKSEVEVDPDDTSISLPATMSWPQV